MLSLLKVTADNTKETWRKVPLQDFTPQSDIDWTKSVHDIDLQLYYKYGLEKPERDFIEEKVKAMESCDEVAPSINSNRQTGEARME
jgi:hypothetical protein